MSKTKSALLAIVFAALTFYQCGNSKPEGEAYNAWLSEEFQQPITGWGCFPGWVAWNQSILTDTVLHRLIYKELGMTVARVKLVPQYYTEDGNLITDTIDAKLAKEIETFKSYGINKWITTSWSPPLHMKVFKGVEEGNVEGEANGLDPAFEDAYVEYYVKVLKYLRDEKGLGEPVYATIQNEPDYVSPWDGCPYEPDQWQRVTKKFRKELDKHGFENVKVHGTDHNHYTIGKFLGGAELTALENDEELLAAMDGIAFHSYVEGEQSGAEYAEEARKAILKFKNDFGKGNEIWQTENCTVVPDEELAPSAIRQLRSMMRDIAYLEANAYLYWLGHRDGEFDAEALVYGGHEITKLYYVFQKLWHAVTPEGNFKVKIFAKDDDPDLVNFGPNPTDMLAFENDSKQVVLLTNSTDSTRSMTIHGLKGNNIDVYTMTATENMDKAVKVNIKNGKATVSLPAVSAVICETK